MPKGSCLCGEIQYEFTGEPKMTALCHCHACQKWCGATSSSNVLLSRTQFKLLQGTPKTYEIPGDSGKMNKRSFCGTCGTSLFGELELMPDFFGIKAGSLDDGAADYGKVATEFYTDYRLSFCKAIEGANQEPRFGN
ncbi:uncharacterized protein EAF02_002448 [Botrytis sinoallii]|uniref:uncharacterized protein n=1 Tax=Botrytis sinoallii TaxID=1463999 RepID=UPI00190206AF|nr:uncharacterized protein EAF02_002448 [Botrytis sinoallii]KAF7890033.1 hypothetical protein EAF02_002448 [Botrytis sinoallii]